LQHWCGTEEFLKGGVQSVSLADSEEHSEEEGSPLPKRPHSARKVDKTTRSSAMTSNLANTGKKTIDFCEVVVRKKVVVAQVD